MRFSLLTAFSILLILNGFLICGIACYKFTVRRSLVLDAKIQVEWELATFPDSDIREKILKVNREIEAFDTEIEAYALAGVVSAQAGFGVLWLRWKMQAEESGRVGKATT